MPAHGIGLNDENGTLFHGLTSWRSHMDEGDGRNPRARSAHRPNYRKSFHISDRGRANAVSSLRIPGRPTCCRLPNLGKALPSYERLKRVVARVSKMRGGGPTLPGVHPGHSDRLITHPETPDPAPPRSRPASVCRWTDDQEYGQCCDGSDRLPQIRCS